MDTATDNAGSSNTDTSANAEVTTTPPAATGQESAVEAGGQPSTEQVTNADVAPEGQQPSAKETVSEIPEAYKVDLGEGVEADSELISALTPTFKKIGLTQDQANELFTEYTKIVESRANSDGETIQTAMKGWETELRNDPDFGGDKFDANVAQVSQFFNSTVPESIKEPLSEILNETGLGSHPMVMKYFFELSRLMPTGEDSPSSANYGRREPKSDEDKMYG